MSLERSAHHRAISTIDVLDRVLDKGLSIAGDIRISIAEIEERVISQSYCPWETFNDRWRSAERGS